MELTVTEIRNTKLADIAFLNPMDRLSIFSHSK